MGTYQDYVIKDGKFIGQFEEMYKKFDDPWHQLEAVDHSYSRFHTVLSLRKLNAVSVLEAGCGLGVFTNYISAALPKMRIVGMDISREAIKKARCSYPTLQFMVGDLREIDKLGLGAFDVIILSEIMWYILQDLDKIIEKLKKSFSGKHIIVNQTFYKGGQAYGKEYFTNLDEMLKYLRMELIGYTVSYMEENKVSYETHSILKV